jgi:DNA (cytosine-5)-methyltransferase 1
VRDSARTRPHTLQGDVAQLDPLTFAPCELLIASPPCPTFSNAGKRSGLRDLELIRLCADDLADGIDSRVDALDKVADPRSLLVVEPLRWALALQPRWIALEQVPSVLPLWEHFAGRLRLLGWNVWTGKLKAEQFGVPQTRERAILIADREAPVAAPAPTHRRYIAPKKQKHDELLFEVEQTAIVATGEEHLLPWISMADALGWGMTERPYPVIASSRSTGGPDKEKVGGSAAREVIYAERAARRWIDSGDIIVNTGRDWKEGGSRDDAQSFSPSERPAPTVDGKGRWIVDTGNTRGGTREEGRWRETTEPAPVLTTRADQLEFREEGPSWSRERPATTIQGDPRVFHPGGHIAHDGRDNSRMVGRSQDAIRVELADAAVLQGFDRDYPFQGTKSKQFEQVGNAVPPPLGRAVISALVGIS